MKGFKAAATGYGDATHKKVPKQRCPICRGLIIEWPCRLCELTGTKRTYRGADDDGKSFGLEQAEERRRQEVLAREPQGKRKKKAERQEVDRDDEWDY